MPTKTKATTRSVELTDAELKLSPEVAYYLESRGIPRPTCPPKWKTPEPRDVPGARFDPERVDKVLACFKRMRHTKGEWAGRPLTPDPWQVAYILAPVYGWVRKNDHGDYVRIVTTEYVDVPRKNGKTTLAGGQGLYLTGGDDEPGAEVLAAATGKEQAGYCFAPVKALAEGAPGLKKHFKTLTGKVIHKKSGSYFMVVSKLADILHGANVHGAVIDELHIHQTRDLVDAIETGVGARRQPLIIIITTADDGRAATIYAEKRKYCEQLAGGTIKDPTFYGVIWACDKDDDPYVESTWVKSNPGYGISPTAEYMRAQVTKAKQSPANKSRFCRLHLGLRTKQETKYFELEVWDASAGIVVTEDLLAKEAFGGLDLAATSDLTSLCWAFPDGDGGFDLIWRHWAPEAKLEDLDDRTAGSASVWVAEGWLKLTPGDVVDYDYIHEMINADRERYKVKAIGFDPWNSTQVVTDLMADKAPMEKHRQGPASMSSPTKELLSLLLRKKFRHGGNPLMRWQADNFAVEIDAKENVTPSKKNAGDKIDGMVAAIMAISTAMSAEQEQKLSLWVDYG